MSAAIIIPLAVLVFAGLLFTVFFIVDIWKIFNKKEEESNHPHPMHPCNSPPYICKHLRSYEGRLQAIERLPIIQILKDGMPEEEEEEERATLTHKQC